MLRNRTVLFRCCANAKRGSRLPAVYPNLSGEINNVLYEKKLSNLRDERECSKWNM